MRTEKHEKVLEKLATSDQATIVIERQTELKCALRQGLTLFCSKNSAPVLFAHFVGDASPG